MWFAQGADEGFYVSRLVGNSDVDAVREATDLVRLIGENVSLRPKGREHVGLCPFHDDKNPSFAVVTHKGNAFYKCHSCGAGGDAFDFVMNYHRMQFGEALRFLADRANITLKPRREETASGDAASTKRADLRKANAFAATFFQRTLSDQSAGAIARDVIKQRGINDEMVQAFMIGAAPDQWDSLSNLIQRRSLPQEIFLAAGLLKPRKEASSGGSGGAYDAFRNRLMFPICDELGNPIAFGGRKINPEDEPKYLNSAESAVFLKSKTLFGLNRAKRAIIEAKQAIITEGYTDVIACHQAGICNAVGTLGTALTRDHARLLSRLCETVVLVFDGDEAGQKAADRGLEVFFSEPVDVKICVLPDELDPDELLKQPNGRERFDEAVKGSIDAIEYKINRFRGQLESATGISGRQKRLEAFLMELSNIGIHAMQGVRRSMVLARIADLLDVSIADVEAALPKARKPVAATIALDPSASDTELSDDARASIEVDVPPARRRAELDLLSVLIYQPEVHASPIRTPDDREMLLCELITADHFADAGARTIAQAVLNRLSQGQQFTVQQLLSDFSESNARQLASSLYFDGQKLCESSVGSSAGGQTTGVDRAVHMFRAAATSLQSHISLEQYHQTVSEYRVAAATKDAPDRALLAAQSVFQQRRRQGHIASAIGRGVRSP
jgi:DNA primase